MEAAQYNIAKSLPTQEIMRQLTARLLPDKAAGARLSIAMKIAGEPRVYRYDVRNSVLAPAVDDCETSEAQIFFSRDDLDKLYAHKITFDDILQNPTTTIAGSRKVATDFAEMLEI